jgi:hypothetical protein
MHIASYATGKLTRKKNNFGKERIQIRLRSLRDRTHDPQHTRWVLSPCATTSYTENMLINCIYTGYS